jgi:hypothetical protein
MAPSAEGESVAWLGLLLCLPHEHVENRLPAGSLPSSILGICDWAVTEIQYYLGFFKYPRSIPITLFSALTVQMPDLMVLPHLRT